MKRQTIILEIISMLFMLLFVYTGSSKLMDYHKFSVELGKSPLLTTFAGYVAVCIPIIELIVSIMLIAPWTRLYGTYASLTLMVMFTAYIVAILQFSDYIPCTCGGILQTMTWHQHLLFNIIFILLALVSIIYHPPSEVDRKK